MDECKAHADSITLPIRIMHGGADDMTSPEGSELLFNKVGSKDKKLKIYDGVMHEILNEPEGPEITQEIIDWMDSHQ
jgi:alpha-beta hydrolase superfamily lysophospholipase